MAKEYCIYCGSSWQPERDHIVAKSRKGKRTVPACKRCNRSKSDKQLMAWLRELKKKNNYRWQAIKNYNFGRWGEVAKKVQKVRDE